jgi:hypothetical protein
MNQLDNVIKSKIETTIYTEPTLTPLHIKEERKSGLSGTDRYADYKDITIHSWYLTKGRCSCQRISHTIEIAGLHSMAKEK